MASSSTSYNSPCAACKFLRRKCMPGCIFAPYFPPEEPQKFANVHKIFGTSNVTKLLNDLLPHQREDAVNSLAYEAEARVRDPVYGCVGAISFLQRQVHRLQKEVDAANADLILYACNEITTQAGVVNNNPIIEQRRRPIDHYQFYHPQSGNPIPPLLASSNNNNNFHVPYNLPWNFDLQNRTTSGDHHHVNEGEGGEGRM